MTVMAMSVLTMMVTVIFVFNNDGDGNICVNNDDYNNICANNNCNICVSNHGVIYV